MKNRRTMRVAGFVLALVLTMGLGLANAADNKCPDNFVFLVDQSGSMYQLFGDPQMKMWVAKVVLYDINAAIEKCVKYNAALELMNPIQELYAPGPYDYEAMGKAIGKIKDLQEVFGRRTPLGPGIMSLDPVLAKMSGTTSVIMLSDGMANMGMDPVAAAKAIYAKYPNVTIHIVSFADAKVDKKGKEILTAISKLNSNSVMVEALTLQMDRAALKKFVCAAICCPPCGPVCGKMILRGIHFDFDKYNIKKQWVVVLDEAAKALSQPPCDKVNVVIEGHTDSIGSDAYNQRLSERRAKAVFNYFLKKGISADRMKTVGYGESRPKASNTKPNGKDNPEGRAINRRVEINPVQ